MGKGMPKRLLHADSTFQGGTQMPMEIWVVESCFFRNSVSKFQKSTVKCFFASLSFKSKSFQAQF